MAKSDNVIQELRKHLDEHPNFVYGLIEQLPQADQKPTRIMCVILEAVQSDELAMLIFDLATGNKTQQKNFLHGHVGKLK